MKVKKAVITAAGLGTRVLPASKAMPKEMIPIVDKPAIQFIVEECVKSGITDILIILSRDKHIVEDHFDRSPTLEQRLRETNKTQMLDEIVNIAKMANITYVRQQEQLGLGHAILHAENFAGNEPIAVLYGDDVVINNINDNPATKELCLAYEKYGKGVIGIKEVSDNEIVKCGCVKVQNLGDGYYDITDMIEKPKLEQAFSNFAISGRCILPPDIWEILRATPKGANNELQLTDAMKVLSNKFGMTGVEYTGTRYDMGNKLWIMKAAITVGLKHSEISAGLAEYIKEVAATL